MSSFFPLMDKMDGVILKNKEFWYERNESDMDKKDWYEASDQIKKIVQEAVESKDFAQLSSTISDIVQQAADGLQDVLNDERIKDIFRQADSAQRRAGSTNSEAAERIRQRMKEKREAEKNAQKYRQRQEPKPVKVQVKVPGEISGRIMKWYGLSVGSMLGISLGIVGITAAATGLNLTLPFAILGFLFGTHMGIGIGGNGRLQMAKRFRRYREILGERTHCLIEELADAVGKNSRFVQKDLRKMIGGGYFKEGYIDQKGTMLITDKQTYQYYLTAQTEYAKRELEKNRAERSAVQEQAQTKNSNYEVQLSPEHRELLAEGERYIQHVHDCNERIPGDEMSDKLDRLETVITRIFREAEKNPEIIPELKKMMSYYLPTTRKLLDAYCELDAQPIQGPNVENTKKEIETALDTVNTAFENLLDSLFEETAWDISSDISVLNTMLAQEGLTNTEFGKKSDR